MNFVGHATVAAWEDDDPSFCFGAMLPDLSRVAGMRRAPPVVDAAVRRGVVCHHRVDAVFHDTPTFLALCSGLRSELRRAGVSRPTALAAAHVGVELLLDGELLRRPQPRAHWHRTRDVAAALSAAALRRDDAEAHARLIEVCENLGPIAHGYRDAAAVTERVVRILGRRPRLAAAEHEPPLLERCLADVATRVADQTDDLLAEIRRGLEARR